MLDVVYMDEVGDNLHLTHPFGKTSGKTRREKEDANKFVQHKGVAIYLWWLQAVVKESLHTISNLVPTIHASS